MRAVDLIAKKRDGSVLSPEEIDFVVQGYTRGEIPDYQMAPFLLAVYFQGLNDEEAFALTQSMIQSGQILDLDGLPGPTGDKHSTGGVGDKVSLVLVPLVSACGLYVAKMSGRGLEHTGGTIDKLEAIPGFRTALSKEELVAQVRKIGCAIVAQTPDLVPADGKMYALRDVTATVESLPLIASSVMSKKIACGAQNILIDVKVGRGAFMKDLDSAQKLARLMVEIGKKLGRRVTCVLSPMDEPLGYAVGNALEVKEAIQALCGEGPKDLIETVCDLAGELLYLGGLANSISDGVSQAAAALRQGLAAAKFQQMIEAQGGDGRVLTELWRLPQAPLRWVIPARNCGFVQSIDALKVGLAAMSLGAGRERIEDAVDLSVGVLLAKKVGDRVEMEEPIATLYVRNRERIGEAQRLLEESFVIGEKPAEKRLQVLGRISSLD
ncbi:MAG: thymidine phosphorylase [bacterium]